MPERSGNKVQPTLAEASEIQRQLAGKVVTEGFPAAIKFVAGFDISYLPSENRLFAGIVILKYPSLEIVEQHIIGDEIHFPYVPGYLSFREAPALLKLIEQNGQIADIFVFDGHGIAHPRGLGIAAHIGVLTGKPSIGCAKKKLVGSYKMPLPERGSFSQLLYKGNEVGCVLRTRKNVKPVFISIGNRVNLAQAREFILSCTTRYRIPEPTRLAHNGNLVGFGQTIIQGDAYH